jgi:hypothetical protein
MLLGVAVFVRINCQIGSVGELLARMVSCGIQPAANTMLQPVKASRAVAIVSCHPSTGFANPVKGLGAFGVKTNVVNLSP